MHHQRLPQGAAAAQQAADTTQSYCCCRLSAETTHYTAPAQGVEGGSPMSVSGASPLLGPQHLLRSGSLAAVTSGSQDHVLANSMVSEISLRCLHISKRDTSSKQGSPACLSPSTAPQRQPSSTPCVSYSASPTTSRAVIESPKNC